VDSQQSSCFSDIQEWLEINPDKAAPRVRCYCLVIQLASMRGFERALGFPFFIPHDSVLVSPERATSVFVRKRRESIRGSRSINRAEARDMSSCSRCVRAHVELGLSDFHVFTQLILCASLRFAIVSRIATTLPAE
jgi:hypothetical protein